MQQQKRKRKNSLSHIPKKELEKLINEEPIEEREDEAIYRDNEDFMSYIKMKHYLNKKLGDQRARQFRADIQTLAWGIESADTEVPSLKNNFVLSTVIKFLFKRFYTQIDKDNIKKRFQGEKSKKQREKKIKERENQEKLVMKETTLNLTPKQFLAEYLDRDQFKRADEYRKRIMSLFFTYIEREFNKDELGPDSRNKSSLERRMILLKFYARAGFEEEIMVFQDEESQPSRKQLIEWYEKIFCLLDEEDKKCPKKRSVKPNRGTDDYSIYLFKIFPGLRNELVEYMESRLMEGKLKRIKVDIVKSICSLFQSLGGNKKRKKKANDESDFLDLGRLLEIGDEWSMEEDLDEKPFDLKKLPSKEDRDLVQRFFDRMDEIVNRDKFKFIWTKQLIGLARTHYRRKAIGFMFETAFSGFSTVKIKKKQENGVEEVGVLATIQKRLEKLRKLLKIDQSLDIDESSDEDGDGGVELTGESLQKFKQEFSQVFEEYQEIERDIEGGSEGDGDEDADGDDDGGCDDEDQDQQHELQFGPFESLMDPESLNLANFMRDQIIALEDYLGTCESELDTWYKKVKSLAGNHHQKDLDKQILVNELGGKPENEELANSKLKVARRVLEVNGQGDSSFVNLLLTQFSIFLNKAELKLKFADFLLRFAQKYQDTQNILKMIV